MEILTNNLTTIFESLQVRLGLVAIKLQAVNENSQFLTIQVPHV